MGVPQTGLKLPRVYSKVYMYLLGCEERSRVLPKLLRIKCIWSLQGCELFKNRSGSVQPPQQYLEVSRDSGPQILQKIPFQANVH